MLRRVLSFVIFLAIVFSAGFPQTATEEAKVMKLLPPQTDGGRPLMQCLKERQSLREFSPEKLAPQILSNLLWAADGVNRPDSSKRTAPSAMNSQNIDIYVAMADGVFLYLAKEHALKQIIPDDVRAQTGRQDWVKIVPVHLIYVADLSKMTRGTDEDKKFFSATHAGFISQNVYLYCASEKLATVVRGGVDKEAMAKAMQLRPDQQIILAQSVGYPKK